MKLQTSFIVSKLLILALLLSVQNINSYIFNGNEIQDLQYNNLAFVNEATAWSVSGLVANSKIYYLCANTYILGGYNVLPSTSIGIMNQYFQRIYTNLPPHNLIRFVISIYALDSWDAKDFFSLSFDNNVIQGLHLLWPYFPEKTCGAPGWPDITDMKVFGTSPHNGRTLVFRLIEGHDQSSLDESTGFRDVNFIFTNEPTNNTLVSALCGKTKQPLNNLAYAFNQSCSCQEGFYWTGSNCTACDPSCASCLGPGPSKCFACKKPQFAWNGTHCSRCASGCYSCTGIPNDNSCLPCPMGQIFYPAAAKCLTYCDYPLRQVNDTNFGLTCQSPCPPDNYINGDRSCSLACPAPSQEVLTLNTYKLCLN